MSSHGGEQSTWSDDEHAAMVSDQALITTREIMQFIAHDRDTRAQHQAQTEERNHFRSMQLMVLSGVGGVFVLTLLTIVIGLWLGMIPLDVGVELMRMVIPTVLGAALTIVGTFFRGSSTDKPA